jgi:hypothetical protein
MRSYFRSAFRTVYDNEEGDDGGDTTTKPTLKALIAEHGLQEELNTMMASNKKGLTQKNADLVTQLKGLSEEATMSSQAKEDLELRIEELQTQHMSADEIAKREEGTLKKRHVKELEEVINQSQKWQGLYVSSTTQRALLDAAVEGEAIQAKQIVAMLGPNTHVVEAVDGANKGTGKFSAIVKFNDVDGDGNPITLDLSPTDTIKRMKELPALYGNLFKGTASGGLGGSGGTGGVGEVSAKLQDIISDPVKYREWRKKNPDLDISKLRK